MASKISLGIIIGAALDGSVGSAFGNASRQAQQLGEKLARVRLARDAGADVDRLTQQLARLRTQQQQTGASDTALAADINRVEQELEQARQSAQRLGLELNDLAGENQRLGQSEERLARQLQRRQQLDNNRNRRSELMGETMGVLALGAAFLVPIRTAMNFEHKMADLGATTDEATTALAAQARQLGRDTKFDALGAADAQIALAKAGMDTQKILAATPTVLSIASASHMELGETAELTSDIMHGYSIKMEKMSHVSDILVKTANLSTTSVRDIGESLKYAGAVASSVNVSFEQTNGMLATLSNNQIKGSQAGTALRMGFIRLAVAPKKAKKALEELGVSVADAKGNFRDMPTILKEMDKATSKMGNKDRLGAYAKIFGVEASTAFLQLGKSATSGELDEMINKVGDSEGAAKKMADTMNNTTKGALERMMSSVSELSIVLGNVLLPSITDIADGTAGFINDISLAGEKFPVVTGFIVKTSAALFAFKVVSLVARFGWTLLSDALVYGKSVMDFFRLSTLRANAALLASPIGLVVIGVAALAAAVYKYWEPIKAFGSGLWDGLKKSLKPLVPDIDNIGKAASDAWDWLKKLAEPVKLSKTETKTTTDAGAGLGESIGGAVTTAKEALQPVGDFLGGMFDGIALAVAPIATIFAPLGPIFSGIGTAIGEFFGWLIQLGPGLSLIAPGLQTAGEAGKGFGMAFGAALAVVAELVVRIVTGLSMLMTAIGQGVAIGVIGFGQLYDAAANLVTGFFTVGGQIMDGLLGGLMAGFAKVKAQVLSMGASIQSTFKSTLGIHSPSRVFSEFGGFINEGLQIGLAQSKGDPIGESARIAQGVSRAFDAGMGFEGAAARPPAPSQGAAVAASPSAMSVSITVNQLPGEDSEELANRIMAKIEQKQQLTERGRLHD